jgi:glycosyltransferase involved in cell wall biosynthesis
MRFCMVTTFYPPFHAGGDAIYVQALARALVRRGHDVEVIHCEDAFRLRGGSAAAAPARDDADDDIVVHRLRHPLGFLSPLYTQQTGRPGLKGRAVEAVLRRNFDVIHFHNISLVGGPGILGLGKARVRLYTLHDQWLICATHSLWKNRRQACDRRTCWTCSVRSGIPPQLWRATRQVERELRKVDLLLAPSEFTAGKHRDAGIARPIAVLPNFSRLDPGPEFERGHPVRPRYLFVGRVTASKGIAELAALFAGMPEYDLWVAGGGDLLAMLQTRHGDASNICFLGPIGAPHLSGLYGTATATIIPSLAPESLPLAMLESFAHATPVLSLEAGGCGEAIRAHGAGIVCRDMDEIGAAVHAIARDPERGRELGWRGRMAFERHYTEKAHVAAYLDRVDALLRETG